MIIPLCEVEVFDKLMNQTLCRLCEVEVFDKLMNQTLYRVCSARKSRVEYFLMYWMLQWALAQHFVMSCLWFIMYSRIDTTGAMQAKTSM